MALLSDREGFDKEAYRKMCKEFLVEVMRSAVHHEARCHYEITETNREKLSYAIEGAQFFQQDSNSGLMKSRYYAIECAIRNATKKGGSEDGKE